MDPKICYVPIRQKSATSPRVDRVPESADDAAVGHLTPAADVIEYGDAYEIMVELPGLSAADVEVAVSDREVVVSALKPDPEMASCTAIARHVSERRYGAIRWPFPLPHGTDRSAVRAQIENGLLTIVLPKTDLAKTAGAERCS